MIHNQFRADNLFQKTYQNRIIEWDTYISGFKETPETMRKEVYFKMGPSDSVDLIDIRAEVERRDDFLKFQKEFKIGQKVKA